MTMLMTKNNLKEEISLVKQNWFHEFQERGVPLAFDFTPFVKELKKHPVVQQIDYDDIDFVQTSNLIEMEQFLEETSLVSTLPQKQYMSVETGVNAYTDTGAISFVTKDVYINNSPEGIIRVEKTIGSPDVGIAPRYVIAAKHWELIDSNGQATEELTIMLYVPH